MDRKGDEFDDFVLEYCRFYEGKNVLRLRFLLASTLPLEVHNGKVTADSLIDELKTRKENPDDLVGTLWEIACTLWEIACITNVAAAKACVKKYAKQRELDGQNLIAYRKIMYKALTNVTEKDLQKIISSYSIGPYEYKNIWDAVHHLETEKKLKTRYDLQRFAKRLNKTAASNITESLKELVVKKEDGTLSSEEEDLLEDLVEIKKDDHKISQPDDRKKSRLDDSQKSRPDDQQKSGPTDQQEPGPVDQPDQGGLPIKRSPTGSPEIEEENSEDNLVMNNRNGCSNRKVQTIITGLKWLGNTSVWIGSNIIHFLITHKGKTIILFVARGIYEVYSNNSWEEAWNNLENRFTAIWS